MNIIYICVWFLEWVVGVILYVKRDIKEVGDQVSGLDRNLEACI